MGLRLALLSTARINTKLAAGAAATGGAVEVVAVGSRDRARAQAHADELGVARAHGSYEDVLGDPDVDAVYVPLPNALHVEWSIRALEAGKHVLCEKPMARRPAEVERAFDAAERAGRVLAEAFMWRHHPQTRLLQERVGELGPLKLVRAHFSFPLARSEDVRLSGELEGGALMDVGCYCVSAVRLFAGEPEAALAHAVGDAVDLRLTGLLRVREKGQTLLSHFDCGMDIAFRHGLELVGAEKTIVVEDPWHCRRPGFEIRDSEGGVERVEVAAADPYAAQLIDFAAACAGERAHPFGRADAVAQARAIEMLYASAGR